MKKIYLFALLLIGSSVFAQPDPPNGNPAPLPGVILLVAAGAAVGAKAIQKSKSNQE